MMSHNCTRKWRLTRLRQGRLEVVYCVGCWHTLVAMTPRPRPLLAHGDLRKIGFSIDILVLSFIWLHLVATSWFLWQRRTIRSWILLSLSYLVQKTMTRCFGRKQRLKIYQCFWIFNDVLCLHLGSHGTTFTTTMSTIMTGMKCMIFCFDWRLSLL